MRILALIFFLVGCNDFSNTLDEKRFECGDGYDSKREYIKISGELALHTFPNTVPVTSGGCIERPKVDEIFVTSSDRKFGFWINSQSNDEVTLEPMNPSQLPSACNSVVHGDGRGFSLSFDSIETSDSRNLQSIEMSLFSIGGELIAAWPALQLSKSLVYNFDEKRPVLAGEYRLMATISDALTGAVSKSDCLLRIDYSQLFISPAETVKSKRTYQGQEVLMVQPGYNVNFYVHEGFRDVSIEYCLKRVESSDIRATIDPKLLKCEDTIDFLKDKSPSIDQGFWILNFRGQRGLVRNAWQHSIFLVEKTCAGEFSSPEELAGRDCTTIRGSLEIADNFDYNSVRALDSISLVFGNVNFAISPKDSDPESVTIMPNLLEVFGSVTTRGYFKQGDVFGALQSVWGDLEYEFTLLPGIASFKKLTSVSGSLRVFGNFDDSNSRTYPILFPSLKLVEGQVSISSLNTDKITLFPELEVCRNLGVMNMRELAEINGFESLKTLRSVNLFNLPKLVSLGDLKKFRSFESLSFTELSGFKDFSELDITEIDELTIDSLPNLESVLGAGRKLTVRKTFELIGKNKLMDLSDFLFLTKISNFTLRSDSISSLKGAENLREIYLFTLDTMPRLIDFGPLQGVTQIGFYSFDDLGDKDVGRLGPLLINRLGGPLDGEGF